MLYVFDDAKDFLEDKSSAGGLVCSLSLLVFDGGPLIILSMEKARVELEGLVS